MSFFKIENLIPRSLKRTGIKKQVDCALALERAHDAICHILGEEVRPSVKPVYIRFKTLTIACLNDGMAHMLGRFEDDILQYVNEAFPQPIVERMRVIC